jgi:hypothetical protein
MLVTWLMRKVVLALLCVSFLLSGFSWAGDSHAESITGQHSQLASDSGAATDEATDACDHCCHGTAHQLGLVLHPDSRLHASSDHGLAIAFMVPHGQVYAPLFRPPIHI